MTDLLLRDVPDDVLAGLEANAKRLGLSRSAYLRRTLAREAAASRDQVTRDDLARFGEVFADLDDPEIMRQAWS